MVIVAISMEESRAVNLKSRLHVMHAEATLRLSNVGNRVLQVLDRPVSTINDTRFARHRRTYMYYFTVGDDFA